VYTLKGHFIEALPVDLEDGGTSIVLPNDLLVIGLLVGRVRHDQSYAMVVTDRSGRVLWRGCERSPAYITSEREGGTLRAFAFRGVTALGGRIFCSQPLTAVVQIYDTAGRFLGTSRRAPPNYRPPRDEATDLSIRALRRFEATWSYHARFLPFPTGFLSVYSEYDTMANHARYTVFACDSATGGTRCAATKTYEEPKLLTGDTLILVKDGTTADPAWRVDYYLVQVK
jgi:hypothetical protein